MATHKALIIKEFGGKYLYEDFPKPELKEGQLLIRMEGSTVNPSDKAMSTGGYGQFPLPAVMGIEGTGRVVQAKGENVQSWVGKRVSFCKTSSGTWGQFSVTDPNKAFEIDQDVTLTSAASGVVNPLTVVGMLDIFNKTPGKVGLIHTAAGSSLGRMLNKRCQTLGVPLLNIVRREEQAQVLKKEGAKHIIITKEGWVEEFKAAIKEHGFNVCFDAIGGGQVSQSLVESVGPNSWVHFYGRLEAKPIQIKVPISLCRGVFVTGYMVFGWWDRLKVEEKDAIRKDYSSWLKGDLSTNGFKTLKYEQITEALELSVSSTLEGKVTLIP